MVQTPTPRAQNSQSQNPIPTSLNHISRVCEPILKILPPPVSRLHPLSFPPLARFESAAPHFAAEISCHLRLWLGSSHTSATQTISQYTWLTAYQWIIVLKWRWQTTIILSAGLRLLRSELRKFAMKTFDFRAGVVPGSETCFLFADLKFLFDTYVLPRSIHALFPSKAPGCWFNFPDPLARV